MATLTMFGDDKRDIWKDAGIDLEKFYDEAAVYGMIKMILANDIAQPAMTIVDRAKALVCIHNLKSATT